MSKVIWPLSRGMRGPCRRSVLAVAVVTAFSSTLCLAANLYVPDAEYPRGAVVLAADGNEYRTLETVKGKDPITAKSGPWRLAHAAFDTTLDVPGRFATIADALQFLADASIADTATVIVQLAPGKYELNRALRIGHSQGRRVIIKGGKDPAKCVLIAGNHDGLVIDAGTAITVDGLTLEGLTSTHEGVSVTERSTVNLRRLVIRGFKKGVSVGRGSHLEADDVDVTAKSGDAGFHAFAGSSCRLNRCSATLEATKRSSDVSMGFASWFSSTMECHGCRASGWHDGFFAGHTASIDLDDCESTQNTFGGVAYLGSTLRANGCTFAENNELGLNVHQATGLIVNCRLLGNDAIGLRCYGGSLVEFRDRPSEVAESKIGVQSIAGGMFAGLPPTIRKCDRERDVYQYRSGDNAIFQFDK